MLFSVRKRASRRAGDTGRDRLATALTGENCWHGLVYNTRHRSWEGRGAAAARHELSVVFRRWGEGVAQGRSLTHFHSFYDHGRVLPPLRRADPEPALCLSEADASARGVANRDAIRIGNERGEMRARAHVTGRIPSGVVWMHDGWRGINQLTSSARQVSDAVARTFPAGSASYEARVEVRLDAATPKAQ